MENLYPSVSTGNRIWWLHPVAALLLVAGTCIGLAFALPESSYQSFWSSPKHLTTSQAIYLILILFAFGLSAIVASHLARPLLRERRELDLVSSPPLMIPYVACLFLILVGYGAWTAVALAEGLSLRLLTEFLRGDPVASHELKATYRTIAGITTLTQLAPAAGVLGVLLWDRDHVRGFLSVSLAGLLLLTSARSVVLSERLALLELIIPMVILFAWRNAQSASGRKRGRVALAYAPLFAVVALVAFFTLTEFFRGWAHHGQPTALTAFALWRLVGYYVTALNNGALFLSAAEVMHLPYFSVGWIWNFPVLADLVSYPGNVENELATLLASQANAEFTSVSGLLSPALDFGGFAGVGFWCGAGILSGLLYRSFLHNTLFGLLIYPVWFVGLVEAPRLLYWPLGRVAPTWLMLVLCLVVVLVLRRRFSTAARAS